MKLDQENEQSTAGVFRNKVDKNHDTSLLFWVTDLWLLKVEISIAIGFD